jgi:oligosaccharyltransferase complex subunit alpha (ribophorin I)
MKLLALTTALCSLLATASCDATTSSRQVQPIDFTPPQVYTNLNLVRTSNLDKGYLRETTNVVVQNIDSKPQDEYYIPFSSDVINQVGGLEVRDKKGSADIKFDVQPVEYNAERFVDSHPCVRYITRLWDTLPH